jgi:hypothetical protein
MYLCQQLPIHNAELRVLCYYWRVFPIAVYTSHKLIIVLLWGLRGHNEWASDRYKT